MARLSWSRFATKDLVDIGRYIAEDSPKYARITVQKIRARATVLVTHPWIGRAVPGAESPVIREIIEGAYRIIYRIEEDRVYILRVHHAARLLNPEHL